MASQITSLTSVYSTVYSGTDQRKHQSSASLAFLRGIHRWPANSPHKGPGGCFTNVSRAPQNILAKIHNTRNHIYGENFNLKICTCAKSKALSTRTKFQLEILITSAICAIHKFRKNFWRARETLVKQPPVTRKMFPFDDITMSNIVAKWPPLCPGFNMMIML